MRERCNNPKNNSYPHYGARGIKVCSEWDDGGKSGSGFSAFISHIGLRPSSNLTLDRIDNDKGYEPGNVRWATRTDQVRNRRVSKLINFNGAMMPLAEVCETLGLNYGSVNSRILRGWPAEDAVSFRGDGRKVKRDQS